MTFRTRTLLAAVFALAIPAAAFADDTSAAKPTTPPPPPPAQGGGPGGPGGGGPGGGGRMGGMMGMMGGRDALGQAVTNVGEANLSPDFTLSKDQKDKIQSIRDDFKKKSDAWRTEHAADLKKLADKGAELRNGGQPTREQFQELRTERDTLMATAPNSDDAAKAVMAVLDPDQAKKVAAVEAERQAEMDAMRQTLGNRFGGGGAGGPGGGRGGRRGGGGGGGAGGAGGAGGL